MEAVFRIESARIIAGVARIVRDVGIAEEIAQDALVAALEQWPESGVPDKPGAWLMATAKHRAIDLVRRKETYARKLAEAGLALADAVAGEPALKDYHLLPSVRGDLLARLGRWEEARAEFERAASLTRNARERELLPARAADAAR